MSEHHVSYTTILHGYMEEKQVSPTEYIVLEYISALSRVDNDFGGWCYAKRDSIAEKVCLTRGGIKKLLKRLQERGFIIVQERTNFLRVTQEWNPKEWKCHKVTHEATKFQEGVTKLSEGGNKVTAEGVKSYPNNNIYNNTDTYKDNTPLTPQEGEQLSSTEMENEYQQFLEIIRKHTGKNYRGDKASRKKFGARIKEGWKLDEIERAVIAACNTQWHKDSKFHHLTPEFFTRADKLDKFYAQSAPKKQAALRWEDLEE